MPREVLLAKLPLFDGVLCLLKDRMDREALDAAVRLKVLSNYGVGYDNIDVPYATAKGIVVTNTPDVLTEATADMTFALLLAVARRLPEAERIAREGKWAWAPDFLWVRTCTGAPRPGGIRSIGKAWPGGQGFRHAAPLYPGPSLRRGDSWERCTCRCRKTF
jgi:glyoxylate reductase